MNPVQVITCYERMQLQDFATCNTLGFEAYELHELPPAPVKHVMSGFGPRGDLSATWLLPPVDNQIIRWFVRFSPDSPRIPLRPV